MKIYLSRKKILKILKETGYKKTGITKMTFYRNKKKNQFIEKKGKKLRNGRYQKLYLVTSLPESWQARILKYYQDKESSCSPKECSREHSLNQTPTLKESALDDSSTNIIEYIKNIKNIKRKDAGVFAHTEKARRIAYAREEIIRKADQFAFDYSNKTTGYEKFAELYNREEIRNIYQAYDYINKISKRTIYHWKKLYDQDGLNGLMPAHEGRNINLSKQVQRFSLVSWLDQNKPSMKEIYREAQQRFPDQKISYYSVRRLLKGIPKAIRCWFREGQKAFADKYANYVERDYTTLMVNELWVSDGHKFDLMCHNPHSGKPDRPLLIAWQDIRSRKIVGWYIGFTENQHLIFASLRKAIMNNGFPKSVYLDNGKAFNSNMFRDQYERLGINVTNAIPYNAKGKPVERWFREVSRKFSKKFNSYIGGKVDDRPERSQEIIESGDIPSFEDVWESFSDFVKEYNKQKHRGQGMNRRTPNQVYKQEPCYQYHKELNEELMLELIPEYPQKRKVRRNGIEFLGVNYYNEKLWGLKGEWVRVRYDYEDMRKVWIFDIHGKYVCEAEMVNKASWNLDDKVSMKALTEAKRSNRKMKRLLKRVEKIKSNEETLVIDYKDLDYERQSLEQRTITKDIDEKKEKDKKQEKENDLSFYYDD